MAASVSPTYCPLWKAFQCYLFTQHRKSVSKAVGGDSPEAYWGRLNFLFCSGVLGHRPCDPEVGPCFHWGLCPMEGAPLPHRGSSIALEAEAQWSTLCAGSPP